MAKHIFVFFYNPDMFHHMHFRTISHATEDLAKVEKAFEFITGRNDFSITKATGYHGNEIIILELEISGKREIREFWRRMKMYGITEEIVAILPEIVDDEGNLYVRFDKQEAYLGNVALAYHGDVIAMKGKIESYPAKKDKAMENFINFINSL